MVVKEVIQLTSTLLTKKNMLNQTIQDLEIKTGDLYRQRNILCADWMWATFMVICNLIGVIQFVQWNVFKGKWLVLVAVGAFPSLSVWEPSFLLFYHRYCLTAPRDRPLKVYNEILGQIEVHFDE